MPVPVPHRLEVFSFFKVQSPLLAYASKVTSQYGEDGIIQRMLEILPPVEKYCVEFGAWDGKKYSNTYNLIANHGWGGCLIEGDEKRMPALLATHGVREGVRCLQKFVSYEGENTLDRILADVGAPKNPGLICIDVDGIDYFIWESLKNYEPAILIIEFNPAIPNDVVFIQEKSMLVQQGSSLLATVLLGQEKGYELVCCTMTNAFFVKAEFLPRFGIPNNGIPFLYQPRDIKVLYGYDGTIHVAGEAKMLWQDARIEAVQFRATKEA